MHVSWVTFSSILQPLLFCKNTVYSTILQIHKPKGEIDMSFPDDDTVDSIDVSLEFVSKSWYFHVIEYSI